MNLHPLLHNPRRRMAMAAWALLAACLASVSHAQSAPPANTLRIASAFDPQTMDPHALALLYHSRVVFQVYDSLVNRNEAFKLEPGLATAWRQAGPNAWRFTLRPQVRFHDGSLLTAEDVVFSIERALAAPSQRSFQLKGVTAIKKLDASTVEFQLEAPDAVLPEKLVFLPIMSRAWAEKHGVQRAQDFNGKQETFAVRHAMGTGPFRLERYEPDVRVVLRAHRDYWGRADKRQGNVDEVQFISIKSDATRLAALASRQVELVLDPPFQDVQRLRSQGQVQVMSVPDIGQQYLAFDQARTELQDSDVKGRNPFKDKRVRQAVYQALNLPLIIDKVLRGQAVPTGAFLSPLVEGASAELDKRLPFDPAASRKLLAEAGYPNGFAVTLDCVNVAWRENVCQAITAMLTQVGIRTTLRSSATNQFFPKLSQATASFVEFGWSASPDAWASLNGLFRTFDRSGLGTFNAGRYSNPQLDTLIDNIRTEPDLLRRRAMVTTALRLVGDDLPLIPLYRRTLNWAMAKNVQAVQWPNDTMELRWVSLRP